MTSDSGRRLIIVTSIFYCHVKILYVTQLLNLLSISQEKSLLKYLIRIILQFTIHVYQYNVYAYEFYFVILFI